MSIFDPYQLYIHPQRKSHKGQVIQKKPVNVPYAFTQSDLERAIMIVENYGYSISRGVPSASPHLTLPFDLSFSNIERNAIDYSVNLIWPDLVDQQPYLAQFIEDYPTATTSKVTIAIGAANFQQPNPCAAYIRFYWNGNLNIEHYVAASLDQYTTIVTYTPYTSTNYLYSRDPAFQVSGGVPGDTNLANRLAQIDVRGVVTYVSMDDNWEELNSQTGLETDIHFVRYNGDNEQSTLSAFQLTGFIDIELN